MGSFFQMSLNLGQCWKGPGTWCACAALTAGWLCASKGLTQELPWFRVELRGISEVEERSVLGLMNHKDLKNKKQQK